MPCGDKNDKLQFTGWLACGELSWCFSSLGCATPNFGGAVRWGQKAEETKRPQHGNLLHNDNTLWNNKLATYQNKRLLTKNLVLIMFAEK